jgi:hypothetical protein
MKKREHTPEKYSRAQGKAEGRDAIGVIGEGLASGAGAVGGVAASTTIASIAGATSTTFMGSSFLGGVLGIGTVVTPVGWVIGSAIAGTALAYGLTKMIKSGAENDKIREQLVSDIARRIGNQISNRIKYESMSDLQILLDECISKNIIPPEKASHIKSLIEENKLPITEALERVKALLRN